MQENHSLVFKVFVGPVDKLIIDPDSFKAVVQFADTVLIKLLKICSIVYF